MDTRGLQRQIGDKLSQGVLRGALALPRPVARRIFGVPPINDRGVLLDEQLHVLLSLMERAPQTPLSELEPVRARQVWAEICRQMDLPPQSLERIEDLSMETADGSLSARLYAPASPADAPLPGLVFLHGGGFVIGSPGVYEGFSRLLAARGRCVVLSVGYRLAPEHPFPAAVDDAAAAYAWFRENAEAIGVDPARLAVGGDSAGGNLAAVVCQERKRQGLELPALQVLIYPTTDHRGGHPSLAHFAEGYFLTGELIRWFGRCYVPEPVEDPRLSPILCHDLSGLPPAYVLTAGFDPLRDEGEAYARALEAAGVPVVHREARRMVHGFLHLGGLVDAAARWMEDVAQEVGHLLVRP